VLSYRHEFAFAQGYGGHVDTKLIHKATFLCRACYMPAACVDTEKGQ